MGLATWWKNWSPAVLLRKILFVSVAIIINLLFVLVVKILSVFHRLVLRNAARARVLLLDIQIVVLIILHGVLTSLITEVHLVVTSFILRRARLQPSSLILVINPKVHNLSDVAWLSHFWVALLASIKGRMIGFGCLFPIIWWCELGVIVLVILLILRGMSCVNVKLRLVRTLDCEWVLFLNIVIMIIHVFILLHFVRFRLTSMLDGAISTFDVSYIWSSWVNNRRVLIIIFVILFIINRCWNNHVTCGSRLPFLGSGYNLILLVCWVLVWRILVSWKAI